jgi:sulfur relay (sulfurtransferase) complex TusBCD TusD component (DsrE family)
MPRKKSTRILSISPEPRTFEISSFASPASTSIDSVAAGIFVNFIYPERIRLTRLLCGYTLGALSLLVSNVREELAMARRKFLSQLLGLPFFALGATAAQETKKVLKVMMRSSWGTDDPSRGSFVFAHALALADAGHEVQIFLTGDATYLMRKVTTDAVTPIGWPALSELREKIVAKHIPVFSCGACSRARGVSESDLATWNAKYGNPTIFVSLVEWSDRILAE